MSAGCPPEPIELADVCLAFPSPAGSHPILKNICFRAPDRSLTAVLGATGAGKTTLLRIIAGLTLPQSGQVRVLGKDLCQASAGQRLRLRRDEVAYLSDFCPLLPELSALDNIKLPLRMQRLDRRRADEVTEQVVRELGIQDYLMRRPFEISMGQRRLVGVARSLVCDRPLLVLDEPTTSLDTAHRDLVIRTLVDQCRKHGKTIVFTTHHLPDAASADYAIIMRDGEIASHLELTADCDTNLDNIWHSFTQASRVSAADKH